ncbi:hypothetical protein KKF63_11550 [bacterium]|nr:hypothetical protein [bacterium]
MKAKEYQKMLDLIDDVRSLSFRVSGQADAIKVRKNNVEKLRKDYQEIVNTQTTLEKKSKSLSNKIDQLKEIFKTHQK